MSFIRTSNGQYIREMWPAVLPRRGPSLTQLSSATESWRSMPSQYEQLSTWMVIQAQDEDGPRNGPRRPYMLTYLEPPGAGGPVQAKIHIQGFLAHCNVRVLGDWDRSEHNIPRAMQFVHLHGGTGPSRVAYDAQIGAVHELIGYIADSLNVARPQDAVDNGDFRLERTVFTKITPVRNVRAISLSSLDDPSGRARRYARKWVVDHRIATKIRNTRGELIVVQPGVLRPGDFVDVTFTVDIQYTSNKKTSRVAVGFLVHDIVRLMSSAEVQAALPDAMNVPLPQHPPSGEVDLPPDDDEAPVLSTSGTEDTVMGEATQNHVGAGLPHALSSLNLGQEGAP
ncbi:hypothetical protein CERSUDRAFT_99567 [Gelatoporia subvermispora B]|uniref:Uncharacterized protein n=1 Tax=Ceriporiopsis subvermispora (strain B) TaxID=914234 RepID=M2Q6Q2_CERS8|nr:hypothetical protein CERSUDRAFT_99567 [Gelatoporia subvermispora B]